MDTVLETPLFFSTVHLTGRHPQRRHRPAPPPSWAAFPTTSSALSRATTADTTRSVEFRAGTGLKFKVFWLPALAMLDLSQVFKQASRP